MAIASETGTESSNAGPPPGPQGRFLSGSLVEFRSDPLAFLARCARDYGDVVAVHFFSIHGCLLSHPDLIEQALVTDSRNFIKGRALQISRSVLGNGLITSEGEFWQRQRRLAQPAFHRERTISYSKVMVEETVRMLRRWETGRQLDVYSEMMNLTLRIVAKALFTTSVESEAETIGETLRVFMDHFVGFRSVHRRLIPESFPTPWNLRYRKAIAKLDAVVYRLIRERRASGSSPGDLLSMLMEAEDIDGSRMSDRQLRDEIVSLFLAGHETTALALSWTWYLLYQHPEVESRLAAELRQVLGGRLPEAGDLPQLAYAEMVIKESMRLYPPVYSITRQALEGFEVGGYRVPAGTQVAMSQWVVHRDRRWFDEPDRFLPERWAGDLEKRLPRFAYFPFGGGPRVCIGRGFAMTEAVLLLATIAQRFRLAVLPSPPVVPWASFTLRPKYGIQVQILDGQSG